MAIKLSPPWVRKYREIQAMFQEDPEVSVILDETDIKLYVENPAKAAALEEVLIKEYEFGSVKTNVIVVPANSGTILSSGRNILDALADNDAMTGYYDADTVLGHYLFIVFRKEVVQYFTDDLGDLHGICSTLYQDIAKNIFVPQTGVFFCTETADALKAPLGEWP